MFIDITPNPNAKRFVLDKILLENEIYLEISTDSQVDKKLPVLLIELSKLSFISRLFVMNNFITIIKKSDAIWDIIVPCIQDVIFKHIDSFCLNQEVVYDYKNDIEERIINVLSKYVGPAIAMDGGAIRYHSFEKSNGVLTVEVLGACQGCPSLYNTLRIGIEPMVKDLVPQVKSVVQLKK